LAPAFGSRPRAVLDPIVPPDAVALRERRERVLRDERPRPALALDTAWGGGAQARGRCVLDEARGVQPAECEPAAGGDRRAEIEQPEPEIGRISQRAGPDPRRGAAPRRTRGARPA